MIMIIKIKGINVMIEIIHWINVDKTPERNESIVIKIIFISKYCHQLGKISTAMLYIKNSNQAWL